MATTRAPRDLRRTIIVAAGVLVGVNALVIAGFAQRDRPVVPNLPVAIQELIPERDHLIQPQDTIGVDLRDDLTGELSVDGVALPRDQYEGTPEFGLVTWRPGAGKELARFAPGEHVITVTYWKRTSDRSKGTASYSWRIKVG